jgi:site-specific DNA recombinase
MGKNTSAKPMPFYGSGPKITHSKGVLKMKQMKLAAIYARVSTKKQEQEKTIESQVAALLKFAGEQGYQVPPEQRFIDQGVSGATLVRPSLERLRNAAFTGTFQHLLMLDVDRLARNLGLQLLLLEEFHSLGIAVVFLNSPQVGDTPLEALMFNISGAFAEYERSRITQRMRRGWLYKVEQGERVPQPAPYGYSYVSSRDGNPAQWVLDLTAALVVKQVFRWYTAEGLTTWQIAKRLNTAGTLSPKGGTWYHSVIEYILHNQSYTGAGYYNRFYKDHSTDGARKLSGRGRISYPRLKPRPRADWIPFSVPVIISAETWQRAQKVMAQNLRFAQRNSKRRYLLSGLTVCSVCGHTLHAVTYKDRSSYRCPNGGKQRSAGVPKHSMIIAQSVIEKAVWESLAQLLREPKRIAQAWQAYQAAGDTGEAEHLEKQLGKLKKQRTRLLDAYQMGLISRDELAERQNPLATELQTLENHLQAARELAAAELSLEEFTRQLARALNSSDFALQREVIRLLIERIVVEDEALVVEHIVPTTTRISKLRTRRGGAEAQSFVWFSQRLCVK